MKAVYPVIFTQTDDIVLVEVPDLEILTEGTNMIDAMEAARDAIGLKGISIEDDSIEIPAASKISDIKLENGTFVKEGSSCISLVDIDFIEYRRRLDTIKL